MKSDIRVAAPPPRPLMVFDGDCHFCTLWIRRWQRMTGDAVDYLPSQDPRLATQFPEIPRDRFPTGRRATSAPNSTIIASPLSPSAAARARGGTANLSVNTCRRFHFMNKMTPAIHE